MNTANLQLEGLYLAVASLTQALIAKGALTRDDVDAALRGAEASAAADARGAGDISPANRDAVCFPIRLLRAANLSAADGAVPTFSELARNVGETKDLPDMASPL